MPVKAKRNSVKSLTVNMYSSAIVWILYNVEAPTAKTGSVRLVARLFDKKPGEILRTIKMLREFR